MSKQSQLSIDDILSSVNGTETDFSISNNEPSKVQSIDDILSGFQPVSTPSTETEKDEAGFVQFSGKKDMPNAVSTADDAPPSPGFREARMSLDKAQRELAKDKQIAAATAPQTPEVSPTGFKMPKVDMSATAKTTTEDLATTSPIVKKQVESLLAPKQPSIIEADFRDFTTVLPYTAEDGSVRNYEGQQLDKATIRSFFTKDKDGAYQLPNGKAIYSDALFEKFVDEYYKRYNHPILMQDENYRKDYILRNYGKTEEKFIADATSAMNAQLDRIEEAYNQTRPKIESTKVYPYVTNDEPRAASKSLRDLRKKINSISKDNFWSGFNESFDIDDILALGLPSLGTAINQLSALNKYVNGEELTPEENLYVQINMLSQQIDEFRGEYRNDNGLSMNRVGNIVGFMPQFATQIGVTSKIIPQIGAKAVKDITLKAVADTMKKSASEGIKMGLKKVGTSMLNDAIATPFMTMTHKAYADRRLGHYNWEGENLVKEKTPWAVDYLKALGETFVERHSEQIGEWVTGGLLYGGKRLAQSKLLDNAFGRGVNSMLNYKLPPMLEQARKNLRVSGYIGEVASEIYNNVINPVFTGETDSWKELLSGRYYWDLLTSIAISTGSFYSLGVPDYIRQGRSIKQLDNSRAKVFASISSQPLKDVLQSAFASDNLEVAASDLSAVDWKNISAQDAKAASEYIFDTINSKLLQAEAVEAERLQAFMPIVEGVTSSLYSGGSVMTPQMGTQLQTAELKDGSTAFIIWGDVQDADTTQFVVKAADGKLSTINREDIAAVKSMDMSDYLAEQYSLMFSDSINKERLTNFIKDLNTAQQNNASPEAISTIYDRSGYVLFNEGDSVTLTDGSIGVVAGYRDGKYLIAEPTNPDIVSVVGFLNILQPNVDIATAQAELVEEINNGSVEIDTTIDDSYVSEEDILRQKLESAAEQISTTNGNEICVIRLRDGKEAVVKQGQIVLNADGTIDADNSTPTIVIRDTESQAIQQIGIEEVDSVIEELNAQEAIEVVQSSIEEQIAKRDLIAEIFAQQGVVDVILTSGNSGQIVEILTDESYTFNWVGEDKQMHSIDITLDQVAEVLPPKEESTPAETDNTESAAETIEEDIFEGFNPEPINFDNVDWDNISTTDYINLSVLAYGPAETLSRTRGYYLKSKENVEKAQKRVEAQDAAIAKLKAKYADLAGPGEAVKLDKKVREAEAEKAKRIAAITKLEQEVAKYAKTLEQLGVNIQEEVAIINDRKNLERQKAELVEADANLDKFAEQGTSEAVNTIVNNEANRNRIYNLYASRGVAPDQAGVTSAVLWDIVTGNLHLRWEDYKTDAGNVEKGLASELGLTNSAADKRAYKAVLDKNGMSVDSYVHSLWERMDGYSNELDDMDMKNEVLSVLQSTPNGTAALQTLYDALGIEDAAEESYSMNKAEIAQQIADIDKQIAENAVAQTEFNKKVQNKIDQLEGKNVPAIAQNSQNNNNFAENDDTDGREETNIRRDNIPSLETRTNNSSSVDTGVASGETVLEQSGDNISNGRGDIRVFEQGLGSERSWSDADNERAIQQAVSQRLVEIAQENGLFIPLADTKNLGEKYQGRTGESTVYINKTAGKVYKVKNPYAKSALKKVAPQDAIYEHIIHNLIFPEVPYKFEGISKDVDGVRIILSQPYIKDENRPSQSQIEQALAARGLYPDGRYSYGNDYISVTDVEGDNVILGEDGTVYFIDPIIKFKKPATEIIEKLSEQTSDIVPLMIGNFKIVAPEGTSAEKWAAVVEHLKEIIGADNVITDEEQLRQILNTLLQSEEIRAMIKTDNIFYSDAERAVREIKQEKATPQQWLAMLQKNGGLKAGEDKWIGLSDWLKASEKKTLTKQEVLDYIRANKIQIEEVEYAETDITDITGTSEYQALKDEFEYIHSRIIADEWRKADKYSDSLIEKYGFQNNTIDMEALSDGERDTLTRLQITDGEAANLAWVEMLDRYGDDFEIAFDTFGGRLFIKDEDAARSVLGISDGTKPINSVRKRYTTDGLDNLREIALTVPTIDSWQENDNIHFGDAGEGRAIAWIRFGETTVSREVEVVREAVLEAPFKAYNGHDIYGVKDTNGKHFIIYGKLKNGQMMYVPQINGKYIGETVETAAFDTLEQAQEALAAYYKAHPIRKTINEQILVIDEIQSNRHQEGRKRGYESKEDKAALDAIIAAREELGKEQRDFEYRTGQAWQRWQNGEISEQEYNEMWNTQFDAENKALRAKQEAIDAQLSEYKKNKKPGVIPAAPFESNWAELAFKRMLRYAAENGFDKVAWTTGAQQAERYSLNNYFSSVSRWDINTDDMPGRYYTLNGSTKIGINVNEDGQIISASLDELVGKPLSDVVGKEVASKMMEMEDRSSLEDIEFQIGGEGMKAFYDKMLVSFMNKYGKKWGARVGEVTMPELGENNTMHAVDVTNAMRISVLEGQPMFRAMKTYKGEVYGFTYNGKIYLDPTTMNIEAPIHEYTELWSAVIEKQNPELWAKGKELLKQTITWKQVNSDPNYKNLPEDLRASETLSRIVAAEAAKKINEVTDSKNLIAKLRAWIRKFWNTLKATFSEWSAKDIDNLTLREFKAMPLRDFIEGVNPLDYQVSNLSGFAPSLDAKELEEIRAERKQIEEQAKANGTWLKAPNGQPTNLTPEQWVTVRTRRFKEWFGDWEKTLQIEKLRKSKAVSISGKEFEITDDFKQNKKNALKYSQSFTGEYTNTDTGTTIAIYRGRQNGGVNEVLQHNYKDIPHIQSIAAIPDIIKNSIYIESQPNNDVEKNPNVAEYQCYVCGLNIAGEDYTVLAKIAVDKKGNRYYDHNLTAVEKGKLIDIANNEQSAVASGFGTTPDTKSTTNSQRKYRELLSILQINSSKVVDANGEPKLVYHGTRSDFYTFGNKYIGTNLDFGTAGKGFYFTEDKQNAQNYANNAQVKGEPKVIAVFLNIRKPKEAWFLELDGSQKQAEKFTAKAIAKGFDGVQASGIKDIRWWVAFDPNQIKSVDNTGTFDSADSDIRYSQLSSIDAEYMEAVRSGDMERAKELVRQYAEIRGYTTSQNFRDAHGAPTASVEKRDFTNAELINQQSMDDCTDVNLFSLPQGENLAPDGFWSPQGPRWYMYNDDAGMQAYAAISSAIRAINYQLREYGEVRNIPTVKVYRAVPNSIEVTVLQNGDWVTPSKLYADRHGKARFGFDEYKIIEQEVPATELWWDGNDAREWGYDNGNVEATANTPNNVKLLDPITYDDNGNIIPLSSRFDRTNSDIRFMFVGEKGAAMDAEYKQAIRDKNYDKALSLLDAAAEIAMPESKVRDNDGRLIRVSHYTNAEFTEFDPDKIGSSTDYGVFGRGFYFGNKDHINYGSKRYEGYLNLTNPIVINGSEEAYEFKKRMAEFSNSDVLNLNADIVNAYTEHLKAEGYDGVIYNDELNNNEYVAFYPNQFKLADFVEVETYDDNGNIIPLSSRFDKSNSDIRFMFVGEKGAAAMDAAEEATIRLDNLAVAREMEEKFADNNNLGNINEQFNEGLKTLTEDNARSRIFDLGTPSPILLASGIEDKPIRLYGAKLLSKSKKHNYELSDLKDFPKYVASPIAVFKGAYDGAFAVLTELVVDNKNMLATLSVGKGGHDVDFNIVTSVYDKRGESIVRWINDNKLLYVNKEKALNYFSDSAPIAEAQNNQELVSTTKIIQNFENPTITPQNIAKKIKLATGWERGADDKWRYEVPDVEVNQNAMFTFKDDGSAVTILSSLVNSNELFAAYPQLEDMPVVFREMEPGLLGGYNEFFRRIELSDVFLRRENPELNTKQEISGKDTIIHEIQHVIQGIEGFARGGNANTDIPGTDDAEKRHLREVIRKAISFVEFFQNSDLAQTIREAKKYKWIQWESIGPEAQEVLSEYLGRKRKVDYKDIREYLSNAFNFTLPKKVGETNYRKLAGEVEARNVEARMNMTPEQRRESLASETQDVATEDQIFLYHGMGVAHSVDVSQKRPATAKEKNLQVKIEELQAQLKDNKKNLNSTLLRIYELLVSPDFANVMETGIGKVQYRSVVKSIRTAIEQSYGKKDLSVVQKIVDKYLYQVQDVMALLLSRRRLNELTQILNTTVEGYTPQGVRLGKRIDDETRETFKTIRRVLAEEYTPELVERHYEEGTKLVRKAVQYRLRKLTVDGVDINTDFRLKTKDGGIISDLREKADDIIANYGDVPSSEDVKKAGRLLYVANVLESYDDALSLNSEIGVVTEEIKTLENTIQERAAAHRAAAIGSPEKAQLWDDLKALRLAKDAATENRAKLRNRYSMLLNTFVQTLNNLIEKGVNDLKLEQGNKVEEELNFRRGIYRSIKDPSVKVLPSKESDESGKKKPRLSFKKFRRSTINENLFMRTFAELSKEIDITSIPGSWLEDGWYYQFMLSENGYIYRSDWRYNEEKRIQKKIDDKVRSIFGKSSIKDKLFAQSTNPMNVIAYLAQEESGFKINRLAVRVNDKGQVVGGYQENIPLSIGNLLYIRNTVRQPGGKAGYVAWGISETRLDDIVAYVEENYPEYCQFADWVVNDLLPELYQMQDAIYFKRFDTHLTQTPFYFPIVRDKRFVGKLPEVGEGEVVMPSSVTGNIIERVKTSAKMDLAADMFSVLSNHIKETLDWCAYSELTRKFNMFSTSRNFRNILDAQDFSVDKLKETYEIAIGQSKMRNADDGLTRALNSVSKTLVAGNIVFNLNAALKQFVSATAILGYSADPKFFGLWIKNYVPSLAKYSISKVIQMIKEGTINPEEVLDVKVFLDNWRWAVKNVPTMQARWEGGKAGFEVFKAEGVARWDKVTNWIANLGLWPNAFVDMITCANGTRTVYEYQYAKNIKQGMSEEQAHKDACVKAAVLINETQQSSLDGFLSSFQSGGGIARILGVGLGAYQNTSMAFARNEWYSIEQIFRMLKKSTRSRMIDFKTEEYRNRKYTYDKAHNMAENEFKSAFWAQVSSFLHNAIISNYIWLLATPLSAIVANIFGAIGDEDERRKFWANEVVRKQFADILTWESIAWQAPLLYNHPITKQLLTAAQRLRRGENYGSTFESPVVAEIDDLLEAISQQWIGVEDAETGEVERKEPIKYEQTVEYIVWAYLLKSGTSLSQRIISNVADGIKGMIEDGVDPVDIMNILSSPRSITRAIAGEPREGESQKEYLDRMSYVYRMINAGSGDYDSKWQKERIKEYIRNNERPLYEAMGIDPLEVTKLEAHRKAIDKGLLLQRSGNKAKVKDKKVEEYKALSARGKEYQSQMFTLSVQIKALDQRLETMIEFDSERSELLRQKYNLEKELYNKWQEFIKL